MGVRHRLAELMDARGVSQAELARRLGEHPNWVNNRVRGVVEIRADDVPRMAAALGIPAAAFFEGPRAVAGEASYGELFVEAVARGWHGEMAESDRELLEEILGSVGRYRERLLREERPGE